MVCVCVCVCVCAGVGVGVGVGVHACMCTWVECRLSTRASVSGMSGTVLGAFICVHTRCYVLRDCAHTGCVHGAGVQGSCAMNTLCMCPVLYAVCVCVLHVICMQCVCEHRAFCVHSEHGMWGGEEGAAGDYISQPPALGPGWWQEAGSSAAVLAPSERKVVREGLSEEVAFE